MRILRVITRMDVHGGAELSTLVELEALAGRGHDALVVTLSEPTTPAAVERLDAAGVEHRHLAGSMASQAHGLWRLVGEWWPDVVHAVILRSEVVTAVATLRSRVPTVASLVNMQYAPEALAQAPSPRRLRAMRRIESIVLGRGFDHFHCLTEEGARHSVDQLGLPAARITVIPRGRRPSQLQATPAAVQRAREELAGEGRALVLNVGRHESQKGQDLLFEAVGQLVDRGVELDLVVAGREGNRTASLLDQIRRRGLSDSVVLLGARQDVPALLAAADVVCVSSRWEGLGGAVVEALGAGAAVVAFGIPVMREVIGDAGVLVDPFDTSAFADALGGLLVDETARGELSRRAHLRFMARYEIGAVVDRVEAMYRDLCGSTEAGRSQ